MYEFIDAIKKCFVIDGRTSRMGYWVFVLFYILFGILFFVALIILSKIIAIFSLGLGIIILLIPWFLYCFFIAIAFFTITIRRLHDINKSGWWIFIGLIPIIGIFWLFFLSLIKGDDVKNEYGEVPVKIIGKPIQWRKIITIMIFVLLGIAVVLFFIYIINDSIKSENQKKVNEANTIMIEEEVNSVILPASFTIETTSKNSSESASTESKGSLTFINGTLTEGEFIYKVQEGSQCKNNCYNENSCVITNGKWVGSKLESNSYCSRLGSLGSPTILEIKKEIAEGYYIPFDKCTAGLLTCYKITEIK